MEVVGIPLLTWKPASVDLQADEGPSVQGIGAERRTDNEGCSTDGEGRWGGRSRAGGREVGEQGGRLDETRRRAG